MPIPLIIPILMAAAAVTSAYSAYSSGQAQARTSAYNALIARQNASLTAKQMEMAKMEKGIIEARARAESKKTLASQRTGYAKAGVTGEGTPLLAAAETMTNADLDALAIRYASTVEQGQLLSQQAGQRQAVTLEKMRAKAFNQASYIGAGASLITGASKIGGLYA